MAIEPFHFPFPFSALLLQQVPLQNPPTVIQLALAPAAAQSFGKHIGPLYRTPSDFAVHT